MRESWTDDRLDYLNRRVDDGFERVGELFERVDERFDDVNRRLDETNERITRLEVQVGQLTQGFIEFTNSANNNSRALIVTMVLGSLTVLVTVLSTTL